jgi:photosystem II stability/assembly factor-like uncharacterized protein
MLKCIPHRISVSVIGPVLRTALVSTIAVAALMPPPLSAQEVSAGPNPMVGQQAAAPVTLDPALLEGYRWRNIGPDRGGRSIAVSGVVGRPEEAYFGAVGGGLWKTTDWGENWVPVTDFKITSASVGAVDVSETNPDLVFMGMGESCIRGNIMPGDGVYRSIDAGENWEHVGFRDSDAIAKIRVHPTNPDIVFVASFGKYGAASEERGLFKSTDGGDTWRKVLYRDDKTGAVDISIDRNNPDVMYVALWEAFRKEYQMSSGGPGSGIFKSTDGGESWTEITRNPGLPQEGLIGRVGIDVSGGDSNRVYALVENDNGGLFRSDDAGATWELVNDNRSIRQRAFYYTHLFADSQDPDVVYMQNTTLFRSTDGGETTRSINNGTHGDFHDLWIDPDDPSHMVVANDGGGAVTMDTGEHWTDLEFSTAQFYHVITTKHIPYHVCGAQQDNSTLCIPYDWNASAFGFGGGRGGRGGAGGGAGGGDASYRDITAGAMAVAYRAGGGEPGYIAPDPQDIDIYYSGTNNGGYIDKFNRRLGTHREVNPYPWFYSGEPSSEIRERWQWTIPIIFSPIDPNTLYTSSQRLWKTTDGGKNWTALSGDLTRHDPSTLGPSGGPITHDMNGPEVYATIFSVAPGKVDIDVIFTGSDDGLVHVTRNGGDSWTNVTPPDMPEFGRVSQIDASAFDAGTAYVAVKRPLLNDQKPYIFKTTDYGQSWTNAVTGIREDAYVHVVREDPTRQGLLYAGTQHGVYISYDDGALWQPLNPNLPDLPIVDLVVEANELVISAHGRGFWVLDNIAPLRQATAAMTSEDLLLFTPPTAVRSGTGVTLSWWLADGAEEATLEILDGAGNVLRSLQPRTQTGLNQTTWNLLGEGYVSFPGMIFWGARSRGPAAPPGQYTLRLTADGQTATAPLTVKRNPLIRDVTDADLQAQYEFSSMVRDRVTDANEAVIAIRRVKAQLTARYEESEDRRLRQTGDRLLAAASAVEENIYQVRNQSGQDPLNFPIKVNNRLANLMSMAERGDGRPGNMMPEIFNILSEELAGYESRLEEIWATDLRAVNAELRRLDLTQLDPNADPPGGPPAGSKPEFPSSFPIPAA